MRSGSLRHYVALQSYTETRDAVGGQTKTWATYASVWAAFRTLSGRERDLADQEKSIVTHEVTIRYRSDVHADHRILWGSRAFDIKDVRNFDERDRELRMRCCEVTTAGPAASGSASASPSASVSSSPSASASAS